MPARRDDPRLQQRRRQVAEEAARLIDEGAADPAAARRKAAQRLGVRDEASLPGATEIQDALQARRRLFGAAVDRGSLRRQREAAGQAMAFLAEFSPRLAGPVLEGGADPRAPVVLHLHPDDAGAVAVRLQDAGIPATERSRRVRLDARHAAMLPCWEFQADGVGFELWVLPAASLRQAPLDEIDGTPVARASLSALNRLLDADTDG